MLKGTIASLIATIIAGLCVWGWRRYRRRRAGESGPGPPSTRAPADSRDLLKSYPEQQDKWVGRDRELGELSEAWEGCEARVFAVVGFGGQGKSALARRFTESLRRDKDDERRPVVVWWSFYLNRSADEFFDAAARHLRIPTQDTETGRKLTSERLAEPVAV